MSNLADLLPCLFKPSPVASSPESRPAQPAPETSSRDPLSEALGGLFTPSFMASVAGLANGLANNREDSEYSYALEVSSPSPSPSPTTRQYTAVGNNFVVRQSLLLTDSFSIHIRSSDCRSVGVLSFTTTPQTIFHGSEQLTQSTTMYWNTLNLDGRISSVSFDWLSNGTLLVNINTSFQGHDHQVTLQVCQRMQ